MGTTTIHGYVLNDVGSVTPSWSPIERQLLEDIIARLPDKGATVPGNDRHSHGGWPSTSDITGSNVFFIYPLVAGNDVVEFRKDNTSIPLILRVRNNNNAQGSQISIMNNGANEVQINMKADAASGTTSTPFGNVSNANLFQLTNGSSTVSAALMKLSNLMLYQTSQGMNFNSSGMRFGGNSGEGNAGINFAHGSSGNYRALYVNENGYLSVGTLDKSLSS